MPLNLKNKKILLVGLGVLGGGLNTAKWLIKQGVKLTITDLKKKNELKNSFKSLNKYKSKIRFVLGKHDKKDFLKNEIIVVNPGVSLSSPYLRLAAKNGKQIENELTLFYKSAPTRNIIAVTGTRGKTTTANWAYHLIKQKYSDAVIAGNSPDEPLLEKIEKVKKDAPVVLETPSFLLEHAGNFHPRVAIITNVYKDHLNRYENIEHYAITKANIFKNQTKKNLLVLNKDNGWTKFFLKQIFKWGAEPEISFFSPVKGYGPTGFCGLKIDIKKFAQRWGKHNLENLAAAVLAAQEFGISENQIIKAIKTLPQIKFRQELIYKFRDIKIYNDTAATSPEATIVALERFGNSPKKLRRISSLILITGGTDRNLDFSKWARTVKKYLPPENVIFLSGSATEKMKKELKWERVREFETLKECVKEALKSIEDRPQEKRVVLFSPSSKSFEKFRNEFDRGEQFNRLAKDTTSQFTNY